MSKQLGFSGHFTLVAVNADTGESRELASFDNLITDIGLERLGSGGAVGFCHVGSGSAAPVATNTALASFVASTALTGSTVSGAQATAPYFGWTRFTYRFAAGVAAGNLSEIGISWTSTSGNLFSRALIKDSGGTPTTITVLSNEFLDVTYELRMYPPTTDSTFTTVIGGVTYDCVLRASEVTDGSWAWRPFIVEQGASFANPRGNTALAYDGTLGAITATPSGTGAGLDATDNAYVANSKSRSAVLSATLGGANFTGGIDVIYFLTRMGTYQVSFNPPIAKDNTKTLAVNAAVSWARRP